MYYIILLLAAILVGTSIGAILGSANRVLRIGAVVAIVLGAAVFFTGSWIFLALGAAALFVVQVMQRDSYARA